MKTLSITEEHPLMNPLQLRIRTPAVEQLFETLTQWLWTGATGGFIEGPPRSGKTTALKMLCSELTMRTGRFIPCHLFSVPPRDRSTILGLYRNLCISAGIDLSRHSRPNSDLYLEDFLHYLTDTLIEHNTDQMVLLVDETQRLHIDQIEAFAELHDLLAKNDKMLSVFFTGNDTECDKLIQDIEDHSRRHVYGRFFTRRTTFDGIRTKAELKTCLKQYDQLRYPEHNGPSYTAGCLPEDVQQGFRLDSLTPEIWEIYRDLKTAYGFKSWGMKYFTSAIQVLLLDYLAQDGVDAFCPDMFYQCVESSGMLTANVRAEK